MHSGTTLPERRLWMRWRQLPKRLLLRVHVRRPLNIYVRDGRSGLRQLCSGAGVRGWGVWLQWEFLSVGLLLRRSMSARDDERGLRSGGPVMCRLHLGTGLLQPGLLHAELRHRGLRRTRRLWRHLPDGLLPHRADLLQRLVHLQRHLVFERLLFGVHV